MTGLARTVLTNPIHFLAFGFGAGLSPKAPGTVGTIVAVPFYLVLAHTSVWVYVGILAISLAIGIWLCGRSAENLGVHDHGGIVWDEFVGMWIACLPLSFLENSFQWLFTSFFLFRLFDIWKPIGIKFFDKKHGAFNVMMDDVIAGIYSAILVIFLSTFFQ